MEKMNKPTGKLRYHLVIFLFFLIFFICAQDVPLKDQTVNAREKNPKVSPGPQAYFKGTKFDPNKKELPVFNREKGEKKIYKPMASHVF